MSKVTECSSHITRRSSGSDTWAKVAFFAHPHVCNKTWLSLKDSSLPVLWKNFWEKLIWSYKLRLEQGFLNIPTHLNVFETGSIWVVLVAFALIYLAGFGGTLQIMSWILCALHLSGKLAPKRAYIGTCWQSASPVHLRIAGADFFWDEVVLVDVETGCLDNLVLSFAAGGSEMYISFIYGCNNVWFGGADLNIRCFCTRVWNKIKV